MDKKTEKRLAKDPLVKRLGDTLVNPDRYAELHKKGVKLREVSDGHEYNYGQTKYPSVTTILQAISYNQAIVGWANSLGFRRINYKDELEKRAKIGTAMHAAAQAMVDPESGAKYSSTDPLTDYYVRKRMQSLRARLQYEKYHTYFTEISFVSPKYEIGGTIDWFVNLRGYPTIADFKSASGMREKFLYQIGGYALLLEDNGIEWKRGAIILPKEENCTIHCFPKEVVNKAKDSFLRARDYVMDHNLIEAYGKDKKYILSPSGSTGA